MSENVLAEVNNLVKTFSITSSGGRKKSLVQAVSGVSFKIYQGETLSLVGESGCGKSTLGRLLINLIEPTSGNVTFEGAEVQKLDKKEMRQLRKKMQIIFQDPYASLNPRMNVCKLIAEPLETHKIYKTKKETEDRVKELMEKVGIRKEFINRYPHQFSGGQRQRIGIARALALNPRLVVCDEPVSALDVSIQSQVLNLLDDLQNEMNLTYLFISHDLSVVRHISDRVCVMFLGKICEIGSTEDIYERPLHPYTKFLIEAVPKPDPKLRKEDRKILTGEIPSPVNPPSGCRFHTRCPYAKDICSEQEPEMKDYGDRSAACHFVL
ncbi:MAG: dipeptide ABC transporter ATP-binding protein [Sedimentibacter sp.]|uniref:ABC transporter ATP-binding protein n=1 Tax=Sedimentibacter sp. TaxID=1960295 RepID=UPI003158F84F